MASMLIQATEFKTEAGAWRRAREMETERYRYVPVRYKDGFPDQAPDRTAKGEYRWRLCRVRKSQRV
jgi:hypothetical protein